MYVSVWQHIASVKHHMLLFVQQIALGWANWDAILDISCGSFQTLVYLSQYAQHICVQMNIYVGGGILYSINLVCNLLKKKKYLYLWNHTTIALWRYINRYLYLPQQS